MSSEELDACMFDENTRRLIQVNASTIEEISKIWENKNDIVKDYIV